jgi:phosphate-selective porin OprO/OprP
VKNGIFAFIVIAGLLIFQGVSAAGDITQDRLKALEDRIHALEKELQQIKNEAQQAKGEVQPIAKDTFQGKKVTPVYAFWENDFYLSTPDENFWMKIRGNLHLDTKFYGGNSGNPTEFDVRRARFDFQGMWYKCIYFRVQNEMADSPYLRNAWVDYKYRDWLHLRAGQMKPPFSTSWWTLDNNVNFLERGANTPLYPYFDRGAWLWGEIFGKTLTWNIGAFTGTGPEKDEQRGDIDDHKDYFARLFYTPFKNQEGSVLQGLHLCLEGTIGKQSVPTKRFEEKGFGAAVRDDNYWTWQVGDDAEIGSRNRWGAELHYIGGPFSLSTEYLVTQWNDIDLPIGVSEDGKVSSWSTWVSYFLTGEHKSVSNFGWKQPKPITNFDLIHLKGTGAWEVLARYTYTDTDDSLFDSGILFGASDVNEYTLGLCWTWNPMVRWQMNYVHLHGNRDGIRTGDKDKIWVSDEDMLGMRMIFKF